uniref:Endonuclease/exonuclease/phosphatase domain-containing protein n=1 Tax=viral metagenome TaxID=1070528 RepID=A0A6C0LIG9_9ZZZZ
MQTADKSLSIVTWNINGIRSRVFNNKISAQLQKNKYYSPEEFCSMYNLIKETNADIICLQETRCDVQTGKLAVIDGYNSYFNCSKLTDARGPNRYSGTAIYTKLLPKKIEYTVPGYDDQEGRIMIAYYEHFTIINVYSPNSGTNYENKILFQDALYNFVNNLDKCVIYCGDFNIAIDTHFDKSSVPPLPGTYKHELDYHKRLTDADFFDSISLNDNIIYTWWDQRSKRIKVEETNKETNILRHKNKGWRIDYIFVKNFKSATSQVLKHIGEEYCPHGSDHAPVHGIIKY